MPLSFLPKIIAPKLTDLSPELLRARKIRLLMLDHRPLYHQCAHPGNDCVVR